MSKHFVIRLHLAMLATGLLATCAVGAELSSAAARFDFFSHPDGANYFALTMRPDAQVPVTGPRDVVLLIDTSASQTGDYRTEALATLRSTLSNLAADDRVHLIAVDLNAVPLTGSFVAPGSPKMAEALKKLDARVPLGCTDMEKALAAAADSYPNDSKNPRAAIYIGDGMSRANLLGAEESEKLVVRLVDARIPVSSYAVGPRLNQQLLSAVAGRTGGVVIQQSEQAGQDLAAAAHATVLWPTEAVMWPPGFTVYPTRTPPLRSDRDAAVIGMYQGEGPFRIQMTAAGPDGPKKLSWDVQPGRSSEDHSHLVQLVGWAEVDGGLSLPIVGSASLDQLRQESNVGVRSVSQLARQALASGSLDDAQRLVEEALRQDPHNPEALAVKGAVAKRRRGDVEPAVDIPPAANTPAVAAGLELADDGDLNLVGDGGGADPFAGAGAFTEAFAVERRLVARAIEAQVKDAVNQARGRMGTDPETATQNLKLTLQTVRQAPALNADVRDQLIDVIQAALRTASRRQVEVEQRRQQRLESLAQATERMLINENLRHQQQKVRQLMDQFDALMDERNYRLAEEVVAEEVLNSTVLDLSLAYVQRWQAFIRFPVIEARKLVSSKAFFGFVSQV